MNVVDSNKRLWVLLGACVMLGFLILGFFGREIYRQAPPIPERIVTADGTLLATRDDILTGQQVWQSAGGQQLGSVWGHGAYQAPDWTADWLHREATGLLDMWSVNDSGAPYATRDPMDQAVLRQRLMAEMRTNTFDSATQTLTVSRERANVLGSVAAHYEGLFGGAPELSPLREAYAMQETVVPDPGRREKLTWFFFWTSWAAARERPGARITAQPVADRACANLGQHRNGPVVARSADFLQLPWIEMLRWMRIVGDVTFAIGVAAFAFFMIGLITGWSYERRQAPVLQPVPAK